jgi:hypothetical protein
LLWLAVLLVCGRRPVLAPFLAAGLLVVVPAYAPDGFVNYQTMLFGATAILATILPEFNMGRWLEHSEGRRLRSPVRTRTQETAGAPAPSRPALSAGAI